MPWTEQNNAKNLSFVHMRSPNRAMAGNTRVSRLHGCGSALALVLIAALQGGAHASEPTPLSQDASAGDRRVVQWNTWDLWLLQEASRVRHALQYTYTAKEGEQTAGHEHDTACSMHMGSWPAEACEAALLAAVNDLEVGLRAAGRECTATGVNCTLWAHPLRSNPAWQESLVAVACRTDVKPVACGVARRAVMRAWMDSCALALSHGSATALRATASRQANAWDTILRQLEP